VSSVNDLPLFADPQTPSDGPAVAGSQAIDYIPTPAWFAAAMVDRYLSQLPNDAIVLEPTCGDGAILREIPLNIAAFGVELDPTLAAEAERTTGRKIVIGDVLEVDLPFKPTHLIGNPPFSVPWLNRCLDRFYFTLPEGGSITLLLPAYALQTSQRVAAYNARYSIGADMIPRDIFPGFDLPLSVVVFTKEAQRRLIGLAFYHETADWRRFPERWRKLLERSKTNVWVRACLEALRELGGRGTVDQIARVISGSRPTSTEHWRQAIRKHLQLFFERVDHAVYAIPPSLLTAA
jgi:hypothetical protein